MKVIDGDFIGERVCVQKIFEKRVIEVGGKAYALPRDIDTLKLLSKDEKRSQGSTVMIVILALTIIGLIVAIPWLIISKQQGATMGVHTKSGKKFVFVTDKSAWKILEDFVGLGAHRRSGSTSLPVSGLAKPTMLASDGVRRHTQHSPLPHS